MPLSSKGVGACSPDVPHSGAIVRLLVSGAGAERGTRRHRKENGDGKSARPDGSRAAAESLRAPPVFWIRARGRRRAGRALQQLWPTSGGAIAYQLALVAVQADAQRRS